MTKILVQYRDNWADEMDIDGFFIIDSDEFETIRKELMEAEEEFWCENGRTVYIGTNENLYFNSYKNFIEKFTFQDLLEEEYKVFEKFFTSFPRRSMGFAYKVFYSIYEDLGTWEYNKKWA